MTPALQHVVSKMFCEDTPTSPEGIVANTLNFNFTLSRLIFGGCALSRLGQSLARVKISGRNTPNGRDIASPKSAF